MLDSKWSMFSPPAYVRSQGQPMQHRGLAPCQRHRMSQTRADFICCVPPPFEVTWEVTVVTWEVTVVVFLFVI